MSTVLYYTGLGLILGFIGLIGLFAAGGVVRRLMAMNVAGVGVFMVLIALAYRTSPPDPVPHAMVLTGIVVAVSATGLGLALVARLAALEAEVSPGGSADDPEDAGTPR